MQSGARLPKGVRVMAASNLRTVDDDELPTFGPDPEPSPRGAKLASDAIFLALGALTKRAMVALASLADMAMIGSAFVLWVLIIANPTILQLVGVGAYGTFILAALMMRRRV